MLTNELTIPNHAPLIANKSESGFVGCIFHEDYITSAIRCDIESQIQLGEYFWQPAEMGVCALRIELRVKLGEPTIQILLLVCENVLPRPVRATLAVVRKLGSIDCPDEASHEAV